MPFERRERSGSAGSARSGHSRASSSMGMDGGEAGKRMAVEDEYIRRELQDSTTFCNSFWGMNDAGYPVIQARMKGASRVVDELRAMYKERADIEAEYSKRLGKLARQSFGKDETGSMRAAIDVVRMEIDQTSKTHSDLSALIKKDMEGQLAEFLAKVQNQRKNSAAQIEKIYKQKQTQESYVAKSRDKYEQDCIKINGYTAQSSLVQGRDLDKVTTKLDKAQSTVSANDKDYQNFVRAVKDTTHRWNVEWKGYLDQCQDLEEERLEFIKGNLWNYANAISAVCVADDESCERVRVSLENCEASKDIVDFIQRAGTGSAIADPPEYINYSKGQPPPARPTFRSAGFQRTTTRQTPYNVSASGPPPSSQAAASSSFDDRNAPSQIPQQTSREAMAPPALPDNATQPSLHENDRSTNFRPPPGAVGLPGMQPMNTRQGNVRSPEQDESVDMSPPPVPDASSKVDKRMSARNFMARTPSMSKNMQSGSRPSQAAINPSDTTSTVSTAYTTIDHEDPIAKALANLRMRPGGKSPAPQSPAPGPGKSYGAVGQDRAVSPSYSGSGQQPRVRSPSAAFMQEPEPSTSPLPVDEVLGQYGQHFPGERRMSRQNSTASRSRMSVQPGSIVQPEERARSPAPAIDNGFAGVGARGRSPSPQPFQQGQHPSQHQGMSQNRQSQDFRQQQPNRQSQQASTQPQRRGTSRGREGAGTPSRQNPPARSTTPLGIALDASGSVTHDQMADEFIKRTGSVGPGQMGPSFSQPASIQRMQSPYTGAPSPSVMSSAVASPGHGPGSGYGPPPPVHQQQSYSSHQSHPSLQYAQQAAPSGYQPSQQQQQPAPPMNQGYSYQSQQQAQQGYAAPHTPQPHPGHPGHQDSLGRQQGGAYSSFQSPYNQTPAAAAAPSQPSTPAPAPPGGAGMYQPPPPINGNQFNRVGSPYQAASNRQQTPASAYMQQYQQSHPSQPSHAPSTPGPGSGTGPAGYHQQPQQQQQPPSRFGQGGQAPHTPVNGSSYVSQGQYQQPPPQQQQQQQHHQQQQHQQPPAPQQVTQQQSAAAAAAAPPTGQFSDAGKPILFYVKALYDYQASTEEEFGFTAGDVIAVWETNPDGWWQGELLDDARRRGGANTFPSNFVSLLT